MNRIKYVVSLFFLALISSINAQTIVHSENFDTGIGTWTAVDVTDATDVWTPTAGYMQMNGFGGTDDEDWLISPAINMNAQDSEYFMFDYNDGFSGSLIELYYSTDYNNGGTPTDVANATWTNIPLQVIDISNLSCFSTLFLRHPAIDVSSITGTSVYFAFKYVGTSASSKKYQIDNVHINADYYGSIHTFIQNGGNCDLLKTEIFNTIKNQSDVVEYSSANFDLWDALLHTDRRLNDAGTAEIVWDMFTDIPTGTGEFEFDHCTSRDYGTCTGSPEGTCYNREHTFPKSWWGGTIVYTNDTINFDLHHITPADRVLNTDKLNYPPGVVQVPIATGSNGFKVGTNSTYPCAGMNYFEPIDAYKGDYARMFLFIATRYETQLPGWATITTEGNCALTGTAYPAYEPWLMNLLLTWHAQDPVSQKEIDRNNAVYAIQGNRNPYIDNPQWVGYIWGDYLGNTCTSLAPGACTPTSGTDTQIACDSFLWIDGNTYTTSNNTATHILMNAAGCDSVVTLNLTINNSSTGTDVKTACASYQWIDGVTYTASNNTATHILPNAVGCDSVVTLNLTINNSSTGTDVQTACGSYQWIDGVTYTASNNTATHTLVNAAGCDSVVTLNLTINSSLTGTDVQTACDSYQWIDGVTYTTSNSTATHLLTSVNGCDSLVTLNLTIQNSTTGTDVQTACGSYQWIDGITYTTSNNTATHTLTNAAGCDSTVTLDLTITPNSNGSESVSACNTYTWPANGQTYTNTGTYSTTLSNFLGCDSVVTLNLTITTIDTAVTANNTTLTAAMSGAGYQWLDCSNASVITGETNASFTATSPGSYSVEITSNGCTDTSSCYAVTDLSVEQFATAGISVYPVPALNEITIESNDGVRLTEILLYDTRGKLVNSFSPASAKTIIALPKEHGIYILECKTETQSFFSKVIKE